MLLGLLAESCFIKVVAEQTKLLGTAKAHDPFPLHPAQGCWSCWNLLTHTQLTWLFTSASSTPRLIYRPPTPSNNGEIYEGHLVLFVYCQEENVILFLIPYFTSPPSQPLPQLMSPFTIFSCVLEEVTLVPSYLFHTSGKHWISFFFLLDVVLQSSHLLQMWLLCSEQKLMHGQADWKKHLCLLKIENPIVNRIISFICEAVVYFIKECFPLEQILKV